MVPDLDQLRELDGRTYRVVTNVLTRVLSAVAGGHRNGRHPLAGVAGFTALAAVAVAAVGSAEAVAVWIVLGVASRNAGLTVPGPRWLQPTAYAVTMAAVVLALDTGVDLTVPLVAGMLLGTVAHIAGDMLTPEGCRCCGGSPGTGPGSAWSRPGPGGPRRW